MGPPILKRNGRCGAPSCSTFSIPPDSGRAVSPGASGAGPPRPLWEPPGPLRARARADLGRKPPQAGHGSPAPAFLRRPRGNSQPNGSESRRDQFIVRPCTGRSSTPSRSSVSPQPETKTILAHPDSNPSNDSSHPRPAVRWRWAPPIDETVSCKPVLFDTFSIPPDSSRLRSRASAWAVGHSHPLCEPRPRAVRHGRPERIWGNTAAGRAWIKPRHHTAAAPLQFPPI
jgi:hypothetical protein